MRLVLTLAAVLASATPACAQVVQDRYGPPRTRLVTASLSAPYEGRMLAWPGRRAPAGEPSAAPQSRPALAPVVPAPAAPQARQPDNLYAPARLAAAPSRLAAAPRAAPAQPPRAGLAPPRLYSLHRQYGMAPDAIPPQPATPRYVLIGPPEEATDKSEADKRADPDDGPST